MSLNCFDGAASNSLQGTWRNACDGIVEIPNWRPSITGHIVGETLVDGKWVIGEWDIETRNCVAISSMPGTHKLEDFNLVEREREGRKYAFLP